MTLPVWPFAPDWTDDVRVGYEFRTEIITSRGGKEQRIASRAEPRVELDFSSIMLEYDFRSFLGMISAQHNETILMPDWSRPMEVSDVADAGATSVRVFEVDAGLAAGDQFALVSGDADRTSCIVLTVDDIAGRRIDLTAPLAAAVQPGACVYRLLRGHLNTTLQARLVSDRGVRVQVKFAVDPGHEDLGTLPAAPLSHWSRELCLLEPDWSSEVSMEHETILDIVDYGNGPLAFLAPVPFNTKTMKFTFVGVGRDEALAAVNLFRRQRGQQGEFFMPTYAEDLRLTANVGIGATWMRIDGAHLVPHFATSTIHRNIIVFYLDGTYEIFGTGTIEAASDANGDYMRVELLAPASRVIRPADISMISWLHLWRFASDAITVQWETDEVASIGMTLKSLETLNAEV